MRLFLCLLVLLLVACGDDSEQGPDSVATQVAASVEATLGVRPTNTPLSEPSPTPSPEPTSTNTPNPTPTNTPPPTATEEPTPTVTPPPSPTATNTPIPEPTNTPRPLPPTRTPVPPIALGSMFPQGNEIEVPWDLRDVEKYNPASKPTGFVSGEEFTYYMTDPGLLNQSFLLMVVTCVEFDSNNNAAEWITARRNSARNIFVGVSRDEQVPDVGHGTYAITGLIGGGSSVSIGANVWTRLDNIACAYLALDSTFDSTDQTIEIVRRVISRVEGERG